MSAVAANYEKFQELGVEVITVSVDSQFVHKMWNDEELSKMAKKDMPFHMASDGPGNVGKVYGVYDEVAGVELRGRFIIDPDGVIKKWTPRQFLDRANAHFEKSAEAP